MLTANQYAKHVGLSAARVRWLCGQSRIPGAQKFGNAWMIPENSSIMAVKQGRPTNKANEVLPVANPV